jgi:hypothetical protein
MLVFFAILVVVYAINRRFIFETMFNPFKKKPPKKDIPPAPEESTPIEIYASVSIDDFTGEKMIISDNLGAVFVHRIELSGLFAKLINKQGKDFFELSFDRKGFFIGLGDQISLLFENGYITTYNIVMEPIPVAGANGIRKTSFQLTGSDIEIMKKYNFNKLRLENTKSNEASNYDFKPPLIQSKVIANDYYNLVIKEIENYQPLELAHEESSEPLSNNEDVYVYLMKDTVNGYTKIGISNKPGFREKTLQSEKPTIEMICSKKFPNRKIASSIELALHQNYSENRIRGEWFNLGEKDFNDLKQVLS